MRRPIIVTTANSLKPIKLNRIKSQKPSMIINTAILVLFSNLLLPFQFFQVANAKLASRPPHDDFKYGIVHFSLSHLAEFNLDLLIYSSLQIYLAVFSFGI